MELKDNDGKVILKVTAADVNTRGCDEGVWVTMQADDGTRPTLCMVKDQAGGLGWFLGVYRDVNATDITACDLAISFDKKTGPMLQVTRGKDVLIESLYDLLALLNKG